MHLSAICVIFFALIIITVELLLSGEQVDAHHQHQEQQQEAQQRLANGTEPPYKKGIFPLGIAWVSNTQVQALFAAYGRPKVVPLIKEHVIDGVLDMLGQQADQVSTGCHETHKVNAFGGVSVDYHIMPTQGSVTTDEPSIKIWIGDDATIQFSGQVFVDVAIPVSAHWSKYIHILFVHWCSGHHTICSGGDVHIKGTVYYHGDFVVTPMEKTGALTVNLGQVTTDPVMALYPHPDCNFDDAVGRYIEKKLPTPAQVSKIIKNKMTPAFQEAVNNMRDALHFEAPTRYSPHRDIVVHYWWRNFVSVAHNYIYGYAYGVFMFQRPLHAAQTYIPDPIDAADPESWPPVTFDQHRAGDDLMAGFRLSSTAIQASLWIAQKNATFEQHTQTVLFHSNITFTSYFDVPSVKVMEDGLLFLRLEHGNIYGTCLNIDNDATTELSNIQVTNLLSNGTIDEAQDNTVYGYYLQLENLDNFTNASFRILKPTGGLPTPMVDSIARHILVRLVKPMNEMLESSAMFLPPVSDLVLFNPLLTVAQQPITGNHYHGYISMESWCAAGTRPHLESANKFSCTAHPITPAPTPPPATPAPPPSRASMRLMLTLYHYDRMNQSSSSSSSGSSTSDDDDDVAATCGPASRSAVEETHLPFTYYGGCKCLDSGSELQKMFPDGICMQLQPEEGWFSSFSLFCDSTCTNCTIKNSDDVMADMCFAFPATSGSGGGGAGGGNHTTHPPARDSNIHRDWSLMITSDERDEDNSTQRCVVVPAEDVVDDASSSSSSSSSASDEYETLAAESHMATMFFFGDDSCNDSFLVNALTVDYLVYNKSSQKQQQQALQYMSLEQVNMTLSVVRDAGKHSDQQPALLDVEVCFDGSLRMVPKNPNDGVAVIGGPTTAKPTAPAPTLPPADCQTFKNIVVAKYNDSSNPLAPACHSFPVAGQATSFVVYDFLSVPRCAIGHAGRLVPSNSGGLSPGAVAALVVVGLLMFFGGCFLLFKHYVSKSSSHDDDDEYDDLADSETNPAGSNPAGDEQTLLFGGNEKKKKKRCMKNSSSPRRAFSDRLSEFRDNASSYVANFSTWTDERTSIIDSRINLMMERAGTSVRLFLGLFFTSANLTWNEVVMYEFEHVFIMLTHGFFFFLHSLGWLWASPFGIIASAKAARLPASVDLSSAQNYFDLWVFIAENISIGLASVCFVLACLPIALRFPKQVIHTEEEENEEGYAQDLLVDAWRRSTTKQVVMTTELVTARNSVCGGDEEEDDDDDGRRSNATGITATSQKKKHLPQTERVGAAQLLAAPTTATTTSAAISQDGSAMFRPGALLADASATTFASARTAADVNDDSSTVARNHCYGATSSANEKNTDENQQQQQRQPNAEEEASSTTQQQQQLQPGSLLTLSQQQPPHEVEPFTLIEPVAVSRSRPFTVLILPETWNTIRLVVVVLCFAVLQGVLQIFTFFADCKNSVKFHNNGIFSGKSTKKDVDELLSVILCVETLPLIEMIVLFFSCSVPFGAALGMSVRILIDERKDETPKHLRAGDADVTAGADVPPPSSSSSPRASAAQNTIDADADAERRPLFAQQRDVHRCDFSCTMSCSCNCCPDVYVDDDDLGSPLSPGGGVGKRKRDLFTIRHNEMISAQFLVSVVAAASYVLKAFSLFQAMEVRTSWLTLWILHGALAMALALLVKFCTRNSLVGVFLAVFCAVAEFVIAFVCLYAYPSKFITNTYQFVILHLMALWGAASLTWSIPWSPADAIVAESTLTKDGDDKAMLADSSDDDDDGDENTKRRRNKKKDNKKHGGGDYAGTGGSNAMLREDTTSTLGSEAYFLDGDMAHEIEVKSAASSMFTGGGRSRRKNINASAPAGGGAGGAGGEGRDANSDTNEDGGDAPPPPVRGSSVLVVNRRSTLADNNNNNNDVDGDSSTARQPTRHTTTTTTIRYSTLDHHQKQLDADRKTHGVAWIKHNDSSDGSSDDLDRDDHLYDGDDDHEDADENDDRDGDDHDDSAPSRHRRDTGKKARSSSSSSKSESDPCGRLLDSCMKRKRVKNGPRYPWQRTILLFITAGLLCYVCYDAVHQPDVRADLLHWIREQGVYVPKHPGHLLFDDGIAAFQHALTIEGLVIFCGTILFCSAAIFDIFGRFRLSQFLVGLATLTLMASMFAVVVPNYVELSNLIKYIPKCGHRFDDNVLRISRSAAGAFFTVLIIQKTIPFMFAFSFTATRAVILLVEEGRVRLRSGPFLVAVISLTYPLATGLALSIGAVTGVSDQTDLGIGASAVMYAPFIVSLISLYFWKFLAQSPWRIIVFCRFQQINFIVSMFLFTWWSVGPEKCIHYIKEWQKYIGTIMEALAEILVVSVALVDYVLPLTEEQGDLIRLAAEERDNKKKQKLLELPNTELQQQQQQQQQQGTRASVATSVTTTRTTATTATTTTNAKPDGHNKHKKPSAKTAAAAVSTEFSERSFGPQSSQYTPTASANSFARQQAGGDE